MNKTNTEIKLGIRTKNRRGQTLSNKSQSRLGLKNAEVKLYPTNHIVKKIQTSRENKHVRISGEPSKINNQIKMPSSFYKVKWCKKIKFWIVLRVHVKD